MSSSAPTDASAGDNLSSPKIKTLDNFETGISTSTIIRTFGGLAIVLGAILLIVVHEETGQCKMKAIDYSSWNDPNMNGNLIKWFKYVLFHIF